MEAKDTELTADEILTIARTTKGLCPIVDTMGIVICQTMVTKQAEISFKAGIKEVVDWIRDNYTVYSDEPYDYAEIDMNEWSTKLKEWRLLCKKL